MRPPFLQSLERIDGALQQVEREMHEQLASQSAVMRAIGDHVLGSGGKRLRPALVLLAAELCGYTGPRRIPLAAAIELIHTATLLHDDVVDQSPLRRGQASAMSLWGNRRAVLAGDFFYARACSMITEDGDTDVLMIFADFIRLMAEGELLQLTGSFDPSVVEAGYYAVIERKSASLLSGASETGAVLGGVTRAERRRLDEFGRELGLAFQIRDDALDYASGEEVLGKKRFADLREGKVTLPLLLALKRSTASEREGVAAILKSVSREQLSGAEEDAISDEELSPAIDLVRRYRGIEDSIRRAEDHVAKACAAIAPFPEGPAKEALLAAAEFAVARDR